VHESTNRSLGRQTAGGGNRVEAVAGELVRRHIDPNIFLLYALEQ
jgi:hypothetical protein